MSTDAIIQRCQGSMDKAISHLEDELLKIRTGKANPAMLDSVYVEYYGSNVPLPQVANVNTPDGRTLTIQPWEKKMLQSIERAIINSNLNLNPQRLKCLLSLYYQNKFYYITIKNKNRKE
jgi:ribosome recycling factor